MTDGLKAKWTVVNSEALTGQGYYNEALAGYNQAEKYFLRRAAKQETFVDDKGNLKSRKIPDEELKKRYQEYGRWMTDLALAFHKKGDYDSADFTFQRASEW